MELYAGIRSGMAFLLFVRCDDSVGNAEALRIAPAELPDLLDRAPDGAEALGALAQVGFVKGNAHWDDLLVAPARGA